MKLDIDALTLEDDDEEEEEEEEDEEAGNADDDDDVEAELNFACTNA